MGPRFVDVDEISAVIAAITGNSIRKEQIAHINGVSVH